MNSQAKIEAMNSASEDIFEDKYFGRLRELKDRDGAVVVQVEVIFLPQFF